MNNAAPNRPLLRYFGGKWRIAPWILEHLSPHRVYVEPYGGGRPIYMDSGWRIEDAAVRQQTLDVLVRNGWVARDSSTERAKWCMHYTITLAGMAAIGRG